MVLTVAELTKILQRTKVFERVLNKIKVLSLENGTCTAELKVEEEHSNILGGLHGGLSATLVDTLSTYALLSHKHGQVPNVSVNINMEYIKGAKIGDEIQIFANTVRVGKTLAFLEVSIKDKATGKILVKGSHTKYMMHPK
ncbi:acyl-coenzyme A thioesterase 13-like [Rhynchophorus ferrugineus]|uniref:Thioesterase domain-containing protein n=1 Tax=Rhynchophorus ferrugineus TaxID=354439 RepID=A0A834HQN9_RHYFE|nr:hypothetical protein GWI33_021114 [Rhynchophorus ferrugineus]